MKSTYTPVFEKDGNLWIAYIKELPGVNTQGKTLEEAKRNLEDAIKMVSQANQELEPNI